MSYELAQAEYDAQEPHDGSQDRCRCGEASEDHVFTLRKAGVVITSDYGICPDAATECMDFLREHEFEPEDIEEMREQARLDKWEGERDEG